MMKSYDVLCVVTFSPDELVKRNLYTMAKRRYPHFYTFSKFILLIISNDSN